MRVGAWSGPLAKPYGEGTESLEESYSACFKRSSVGEETYNFLLPLCPTSVG